jgi:flagellar biosynthesis protein FlhB
VPVVRRGVQGRKQADRAHTDRSPEAVQAISTIEKEASLPATVKYALVLTLAVVFFFAILLLYTHHSLERLRACNTDVICQLHVVIEYTITIITAVLLALIIIDVILRLWDAEKRLSSSCSRLHVVVGCPSKQLSTLV